MATTNTQAAAAPGHRIVSREAWLKERVALLGEEKRLTRERDALAARVRELPWVSVDKQYVFDGPSGTMTLGDLFGQRSQLIVYHFMFDPTWSQGCKSCSFVADHYNPLVVHLAHRDIALVTVSKAPVQQIEAFRRRMGWTFPWVSYGDNGFGRDFGVSFTDEEFAAGNGVYNYTDKPYPIREHPGVSVFVKGSRGEIYHTYSTFARGLEEFLTAYRYIDLVPKGRAEAPGGGMDWLRHHDRYDDPRPFVHPWAERPGVTGPALPGQ